MEQAYCLYRVSDPGQVEKNDIPMQKIACHTFAECHGWEITKEFSEKGISGYKRHMDERDAILQIKEDAELGKFEILLVFTFDRIGRRDDETPFVVEWMVKQGIAVWSVCEGEQRFDNHVDKLINYIRYWQAAGESERISERTKTRIRQLTSEGLFTGGVCPYGYELVRQGRENKKGQPLFDMIIQQNEADVIRLIFEKTALEGYGAYRLANMLTANQQYPKSGQPWNPISLYGILRNPIYKGIVHKGGATAYRPDLQIISDELYQDTQDLAEVRKDKATAVRTIPSSFGTSLLSSFLYCGTCGSRMASNHVVRHHTRPDGNIMVTRTRRYYCPQRNGKTPCKCTGQHTYVAERVEALLEDIVAELLSPISFRSAKEIAMLQTKQTYEGIREKLIEAEHKKQISVNEQQTLQREVLACLNGTSVFPHQQISNLLACCESVLKQIMESIEGLHTEQHLVEETQKEIEFHVQKYQRLLKEYNQAPLVRKKIILSYFIERVKIFTGYEFHISLNQNIQNFTSLLL